MNRIYRLVFNRALGVTQAVAEIATRTQGGASAQGKASGPRQAVLALCIGSALMIASGSVFATATRPYSNEGSETSAGGIGGSGSGTSGGGAGGGHAGGGNASAPDSMGAQGSAGLSDGTGVGGTGGDIGQQLVDGVLGGANNGGNGGDGTGTAGGGGGGAAVYVASAGTDASERTYVGLSQEVIFGGNGGAGAAGDSTTSGGGGGGGGAALVLEGNVDMTNSATLIGGTGGVGGWGAGGGGGGAGALMDGDNTLLTNYGSITGGQGAAANGNSGVGHGGVGVMITGDGNSLSNTGSITGGLAGNGTTREAAIRVTGNNNNLFFSEGTNITGDVISSGTGNVLTLSGVGAMMYNISGINTFSAQSVQGGDWSLFGPVSASGDTIFDVYGANRLIFNAFSAFAPVDSTNPLANTDAGITKNGDGTVELYSPVYYGTTTLNDGTLRLSDGPMGAYQINDGTLDLAGTAVTMTSLAGYGGSITNASNLGLMLSADGSYGGDITVNSLTQSGAHVFTLTGTLTTLTTDGAAIEGALQIGNGGVTGAFNGNASGTGSLVFNHSDDVTYAGNASLQDLVQRGTGMLTLTGENTTSLIDIDSGTLRAGSDTALGHAIVTLFDRSAFAFGGNQTFGNTFVLRGIGTFDVGAGYTGTLQGDIADANPGDQDLGSTIYKNGAGTLALDGDVQATHPFVINAGTVVVGTTANSAANVETTLYSLSGTTVGGNGSIQSLLSYGGTVSPGMGQIGTLTTDYLQLQNSHLLIDVGTPGTGDLLKVNGNAELFQSVVDVTDLGGMGPGIYKFLTVAGFVSNNSLTLGNTPVGSSFTIRQTVDENGSEYDLVNQAANVTLNYWNADGLASPTHAGGGSGIWSTTEASFSDADGVTQGPMNPIPGFAIFGGAAGDVSVMNGDGDVAATGMQFLTDGYHLHGGSLALVGTDGAAPIVRVGDGTTDGAAITATIDNTLTGTDGLRKTDAGTLVLTGLNTFTGGVTVNGGTLAVGSNGNLGDVSNVVTLDGGTLHFTGGEAAHRDFLLGAGNGTINVDFSYGVLGTVGGEGALHKDGNGTLTLYGANSYTGGTWLDAGKLTVANAGALGTGDLNMAENTVLGLAKDGLNLANRIIVNGDPTLDVATGTTATLSGAIVDGTTPGDIVKTGSGTLRLTAANTYTGGTTVSQGSLVVGDGATSGSIVGDVLVKSAGTLTFDRSDAITFAGAISGEGTVTKLGGNTLNLTGDSSSFTGTTQVSGGVLNLTGSLGGSLVLAQNAILTGAGKLGEVTVNSGTSMTPGGDDAIGRFDVAGNLAFANGSTYVVNTAADGTSDTVDVTGTAALGGATVRSLQGTGSYKASTRYTILTADGGVQGTFGTLTSNLAFLNPTLSYDANHVYLDLLRNDTSFASLAANANQAATATAIESQGSGVSVYDALVALQAADVPSTLAQLDGVSLASTRTAMVDDARQVRETVQRHLLGTNDGGQTANGAWAAAWGHWGDRDGSAGVDRLRSNGGGLLVGADRDLGGVTLGGTVGTGNLTARSGNDSVQGHSRVAGLYAAGAIGAWEWQAGAMYGWNRLESHRHVNVDGLAGNPSARYDATTAQAYVDGGYRFTFAKGSLTPFVNVARVQLDQDGIHERNSDAALDVQGQNDGVTLGSAGVRGTLALGEGISAHATLAYQQAWGDVRPYDTQRFVAGGDSFTVAGAPLARHAALADAGVSFAVARNTTISASYHGLFGGGAKDQGARMALEVKW